YRLPDDAIFRAMEAAARHNALAIVHAENYHIIRALRQRLEAAGRTGPRWHVATSPSGMEGEAVHRALALAELAGARVLIFHVSCREGVREIAAAKDRGLPAYGETCPQYLVLTEAEYRSDDLRAESLMVIPPIRDESHQAALWRGLGDGRLDIVSTDHNPRRRLGDPPTHPAGTSGIETRVALLHTFGVRTGKLSLNRWVDVCSTRPAQVFGMRNKGRLLPGYDADIVLFDPEKEVTFSTETLHSPIDFCTYDGLRVRGFPVTTISRGDVIVENGAFVGAPGRGRFVPRSYD
ncbi:MAG: amidohydrolase family protein, partial [Anaerolineales bacterium]